MKKLITLTVILFSCFTFKIAEAQITVSLGLNIGSQPDWGPTGYDHADYYYLPDLDAYYDVQAHQYIYFDNNQWVHMAYLPARWANYDLYGGYKVVLNERSPWLRDNIYRGRYAQYRGRHDQAIIRDSHDAKYRNHYEDKRAQQLNQKSRQLDVKAHNLNQKSNHLDTKAKHLNKETKHVDTKKKKDDKHDNDGH